MFTNVSWQQYLIGLGIVTSLYYFFLFIWNIAVNGTSKKWGWIINKGTTSANLKSSDFLEGDSPLESQTFNSLSDCIDELQAFFASVGNCADKQPMLTKLKTIIQKHRAVRHDLDPNNLNAFIVKRAENECSIHLDEEDLRQVWEV